MKSIKPGRGPSAIGVVGSVFASIFGVFWTIMAIKMGAPIFFPIFGVMFIAMGVIQAIYNYKNATGENRYSAFDITEDGEEVDPLEARFSKKASGITNSSSSLSKNVSFCPYCGAAVDKDFVFCKRCGKKLP